MLCRCPLVLKCGRCGVCAQRGVEHAGTGVPARATDERRHGHVLVVVPGLRGSPDRSRASPSGSGPGSYCAEMRSFVTDVQPGVAEPAGRLLKRCQSPSCRTRQVFDVLPRGRIADSANRVHRRWDSSPAVGRTAMVNGRWLMVDAKMRTQNHQPYNHQPLAILCGSVGLPSESDGYRGRPGRRPCARPCRRSSPAGTP